MLGSKKRRKRLRGGAAHYDLKSSLTDWVGSFHTQREKHLYVHVARQSLSSQEKEIARGSYRIQVLSPAKGCTDRSFEAMIDCLRA